MMNNIVWENEEWNVYIDDVVILSNTQKDHVKWIHILFDRLQKANLSVNLVWI